MNLFISDLDGTLLNSQRQISDECASILNELIAQGMHFTIATARSIESAWKLIAHLDLKLPMVLFNGVLIYDPLTQTYIFENYLPRETGNIVIDLFEGHGISPMLFTLKHDGTPRIYYKGVFNKSQESYVGSRIENGDTRFQLVDDLKPFLDERIITINTVGPKTLLRPIHDAISNSLNVVNHFAEDIYYNGDYYLEITQMNSTKKHAILWLKNYLGTKKVISFGDHLNDISMFEASDEKYAVENAHPEVKHKADGIVSSNDMNGVARFIQSYLANGNAFNHRGISKSSGLPSG